MLERVRASIGIQASRFHFRKAREKVISFTGSISSARNALLIMPLRSREILPTVMVLNFLRKQFREENITVVTPEKNVEVMRILPRSTFIRLLASEVTMFYLPRKSVLARITKKHFDLAIDLNLDFVLPSAYICRETSARVRVGFAGKAADTFYNFQIQPDPGLNRHLIYDRLAQCLQMF